MYNTCNFAMNKRLRTSIARYCASIISAVAASDLRVIFSHFWTPSWRPNLRNALIMFPTDDFTCNECFAKYYMPICAQRKCIYVSERTLRFRYRYIYIYIYSHCNLNNGAFSIDVPDKNKKHRSHHINLKINVIAHWSLDLYTFVISRYLNP